jgi:hypothetical protein
MLHRFLSMMALFCYSPHAFSFSADSLPPARNAVANPLHWVDLSAEESRRFFDSPTQILSDRHPIRERLQLWSDALYGQLESRWPDRFRDINGNLVVPRPIIRVEIARKPEAHVSAATVCYGVKVKFLGRTRDEKTNVPQVILINDKGSVGVFDRSRVSCVDRLQQSLRIEDVRELIGSVRCDVHVEDQTLVIGADCKVPEAVSAADIDGIMLRSMAREVTITTGLFAIMPHEGAVVYTLLHELAHYFRSHTLVDKAEFQYFYHRDGGSEHLAQPPRDDRLSALGQRLLKIPHVRTQPIPGQSWHSEMYSYGRYLFTSLIEPACTPAGAACFSSCLPWSTLMRNEEQLALLGRFPQGRLTGKSLEIYFEWERTLTECLASVSGDLVPIADVKKVFWRADIPRDIPSELPPEWRLLDAARSMNQKMVADTVANDRTLTEALQAELGYYTTEEEADNLALTWLGLVGLPVTAAFDHWWTFAAYFDPNSLDSELNFGFSRCRQLYDAVPRWTEHNRELRVPIGSFTDPHHSSCYRIWNLDQRQSHLAPLGEAASLPAVDFQLLRKKAEDGL